MRGAVTDHPTNAGSAPDEAMVRILTHLNPAAAFEVLCVLRSKVIPANSTLPNDNPFGDETDQAGIHAVFVPKRLLAEARAALAAAGWRT